MAKANIGKITQIVGAVLDIKFTGTLPEINESIEITRKEGSRQMYCHGTYRRTCTWYGCGSDRRCDQRSGW